MLQLQPQPTTVNGQKIADGIFWLNGGTHHSLVIEMNDYIVLVDTPNGEARALAVIAKAKEVIPGKPIRYVIATHHHWDHLGGIRTAIDEGATIVTQQTNTALFERIAAAPFTINPDRLSISKKPLNLQTVAAEGTITDGTRTIKLYTLTGFASYLKKHSKTPQVFRSRRQSVAVLGSTNPGRGSIPIRVSRDLGTTHLRIHCSGYSVFLLTANSQRHSTGYVVCWASRQRRAAAFIYTSWRIA